MLLWTNICLYNSTQKANKRTSEHYQSKYMWRLVHEHLWSHFCRTEPMPIGFQYNVQKCISADSKICVTSARIRRSLFLESSLGDILAMINWGTSLLLSVIKINFICSAIIPYFASTLFSGHSILFFPWIVCWKQQTEIKVRQTLFDNPVQNPPKPREQFVPVHRAFSQLLTAYDISEID